MNIVDASLNDGDNASVVTFEFSEAVSGFAASDVTVESGAIGIVSGTGASYTATFTLHGVIFPGQGQNTLRPDLFGLLLATSLGFLMGLADDAYNTRPLLKFLVQLAVSLRRFQWAEISPLHVLDESQFQTLQLAGLADDGGYFAQPCHTGGQQAALPGDEHIMAWLVGGGDDYRLQDTVAADRICQLG